MDLVKVVVELKNDIPTMHPDEYIGIVKVRQTHSLCFMRQSFSLVGNESQPTIVLLLFVWSSSFHSLRPSIHSFHIE
jgi:hypothetical protein